MRTGALVDLSQFRLWLPDISYCDPIEISAAVDEPMVDADFMCAGRRSDRHHSASGIAHTVLAFVVS